MSRIVIGQADPAKPRIKLGLGTTLKRLGSSVKDSSKRVGQSAEEVFQKHLAKKEAEAKAQLQELGPEDEDDLDEAEASLAERERTLAQVAAQAEGLAEAGHVEEAMALVGSLETILRVTRTMEVQADGRSRGQAPAPQLPAAPAPAASGVILLGRGFGNTTPVRLGNINPMMLAQHGPGAYQDPEGSWADAMARKGLVRIGRWR